MAEQLATGDPNQLLPTETYELPSALREAAAAVEDAQTTEYNSMLLLGVTKSAINRYRGATPRKRVAYGAAGFALAAMVGGMFSSNGVDIEGSLHNAFTSADIKDYQYTDTLLAGEADFSNKAAAQLKVKVNVNFYVLGKDVIPDQATPDYEENISFTGAGKLQVFVPPAAVAAPKKDGNKLDLTVDASKVYVNSYYMNTNDDVDGDGEKSFFYDTLNTARDLVSNAGSLIALPFGHRNDVANFLPKPDVVMNDVSDNAETQLKTEALQAMETTCGPKLNDTILDSVKQGLQKNAATFGYDEKNVDVHVINTDKPVDWKYPSAKEISGIYGKEGSNSLEAEPKVDAFKFTGKTCNTDDMVILGKDTSQSGAAKAKE